MQQRLLNQTAVVTGGASGIGLAIAKSLAAEGAHVAILDLDPASLDSARQQIEASGGSVSTVVCDITQEAQVAEVIQAVRTDTGRLNILINNAGIAHVGNALTTSSADFRRVQEVNLFGAANCLRECLRHMVEGQQGGCIVNLASAVAVMGIPDRFAYATSKGAILSMTYAVAKDFLAHGIRCNALLPGRIHTPFVDGFIAKNYPGREEEMFDKLSKTQPIGRMGTPEEVAAAALFLCLPEASFITGIALPVDGGTLTLR